MELTNKGFSLIELSIVLIIIGLLVAGITGGASLIKSAELRSVMSEIRNYQTAVNAYQATTGKLPGAFDDNGLDSDKMNFGFTNYAWNQLYNEKIINEKPKATAQGKPSSTTLSTTITPNDGMPSKIKGSYYALGNVVDMDGNAILMLSGTENLASLRTGWLAGELTSSISIRDAKFLDEKMDDGMEGTGRIRVFDGSDAEWACFYYNNTTSKDCVIVFGVGTYSSEETWPHYES